MTDQVIADPIHANRSEWPNFFSGETRSRTSCFVCLMSGNLLASCRDKIWVPTTRTLKTPPVSGTRVTPTSCAKVNSSSCAIQAARNSHRQCVQYSISIHGLINISIQFPRWSFRLAFVLTSIRYLFSTRVPRARGRGRDTLLVQKCGPIVENADGHHMRETKANTLENQQMRSNIKRRYSTIRPRLGSVGLVAFCISGCAFAQNKAIDFQKGMPFSEGYVAGNTLYVAGQQGPDSQGRVTGTDITLQTTNTIAAIERVVKKAGFQMTDITSVTVYVTDLNDVPKMNEVYKKLMPDPKPARATVQVAGLIGGAKIEISAIAAKR